MNRKVNETPSHEGGIEEAIKGLPVSRRWLLRNTANAAAGAIAASALGASATQLEAKSAAQSAAAMSASSGADEYVDKPAGYVHSLHGWDTI